MVWFKGKHLNGQPRRDLHERFKKVILPCNSSKWEQTAKQQMDTSLIYRILTENNFYKYN